jgi:hypothetical protein
MLRSSRALGAATIQLTLQNRTTNPTMSTSDSNQFLYPISLDRLPILQTKKEARLGFANHEPASTPCSDDLSEPPTESYGSSTVTRRRAISRSIRNTSGPLTESKKPAGLSKPNPSTLSR